MTDRSRREFFKKAAAGTATIAAGIGSLTVESRRTFAQPSKGFHRIAYRELGSTGCKVSEVGFGAMNMRDPEMVRAAIDYGINYIDTAWVYMKGRNEEVVGEAIKGKRDKIFLTTKAITKNANELRGQMEESLRRLQVDHVDLMLFHVINSRDQVLGEDYIKEFDKAKRDGICRFTGVSTHSNQAEVLDAAVESKFWDAALVGYNYFSPPDVGQAIERARNAGLGIIGMKNLLNPATQPWTELDDIRKDDEKKQLNKAQALIKWVLDNRFVDTTIPGVTSFEQLADNVAIMGMPMSFGERRTEIKLGENFERIYCRGVAGCTGCKDQCPYGVAINDINRCLAYANSYDNPGLAWENYRQLPDSSRISVCSDCDECLVKCVNGLDLTENIRQAKELFA